MPNEISSGGGPAYQGDVMTNWYGPPPPVPATPPPTTDPSSGQILTVVPGQVLPDAQTNAEAAAGALPNSMSDTFNPGGTMPGASGNKDASILSSTYQMTSADLQVKVNWNGQIKTIGQVINVIENQSPSQMAAWEQQLVQMGFQSASTVGDPQSRADATNAFLRYLAFEQNQNPKNPPGVNDLISTLIAENPGASANKRGLTSPGAGVKIHLDLSNPLDVKQLGDTIAQKLTGHDLTPAQVMDITNTIRAQQTASGQGELAQEQSLLTAQTAASTGQPGQAGGGIITTQAPTSAEAATTQYLTQHDAGDVQAHSLLNVFEAIKQKVETDAQGTGPRAAPGPMKVV